MAISSLTRSLLSLGAASAFASGALVLAACSASGGENSDGQKSPGESEPDEENEAGSEVPVLVTDDGGTSTKKDGGAAAKCTPNPANYDIPKNACDDDGDGKVDNAITCDNGLSSSDPKSFAKALGVCGAGASAWGVTAARYVNGFNAASAPAPEQISILGKFGASVKPREGAALGVLSTGYAQEYNAPANLQSTKLGFKSSTGIKITPGNLPPGFPKSVAGCPTKTTYQDMAGVHLEIKAPANAIGFTFDFDFFSSEWPDYVCSDYNDAFVAYVTTSKYTGEASFDKNGNPISVNGTFFDRCTASAQTGCNGVKLATSSCPSGPSELLGTGFDNPGIYCGTGPTKTVGGGATGWLSSRVPITPGETFKIEFLIWDTGDYRLDSSVLLDHFAWVPVDATPFAAPVTERPTEIN